MIKCHFQNAIQFAFIRDLNQIDNQKTLGVIGKNSNSISINDDEKCEEILSTNYLHLDELESSPSN